MNSQSVENKAILQTLASHIFAYLGAEATVTESSVGQSLEVSFPDGQMYTVDYDLRRINLSGFPSNPTLSEYIGSLEEVKEVVSLRNIGRDVAERIKEARQEEINADPVEFVGVEMEPTKAEGFGEDMLSMTSDELGADMDMGGMGMDTGAGMDTGMGDDVSGGGMDMGLGGDIPAPVSKRVISRLAQKLKSIQTKLHPKHKARLQQTVFELAKLNAR